MSFVGGPLAHGRDRIGWLLGPGVDEQQRSEKREREEFERLRDDCERGPTRLVGAGERPGQRVDVVGGDDRRPDPPRPVVLVSSGFAESASPFQSTRNRLRSRQRLISRLVLI